MFSKQQQPSAASKPVEQKPVERTEAKKPTVSNTPSIISSDMKIAGDLRTEGDVQVDGQVEGDIYAKTLSVGKTAVINGEIFSDVVKVWGQVNGRVRGRDVTVLETAKVRGDILHESLEVARGAYVEGMIKQEDLANMPTASSLEKESRQGQAKMNVVVGDLEKDKKGTASAGAASTAAAGVKS